MSRRLLAFLQDLRWFLLQHVISLPFQAALDLRRAPLSRRKAAELQLSPAAHLSNLSVVGRLLELVFVGWVIDVLNKPGNTSR